MRLVMLHVCFAISSLALRSDIEPDSRARRPDLCLNFDCMELRASDVGLFTSFHLLLCKCRRFSVDSIHSLNMVPRRKSRSFSKLLARLASIANIGQNCNLDTSPAHIFCHLPHHCATSPSCTCGTSLLCSDQSPETCPHTSLPSSPLPPPDIPLSNDLCYPTRAMVLQKMTPTFHESSGPTIPKKAESFLPGSLQIRIKLLLNPHTLVRA
jgi:hypothetical protein